MTNNLILFIQIFGAALCVFCSIVVLITAIIGDKIYTYKQMKILVICGYFALLMLNLSKLLEYIVK